jgi:hypothetical protein
MSHPRCHGRRVRLSMCAHVTANRKYVGTSYDQSRRPTQVRDPGPYGKLMIGAQSQRAGARRLLLDQFPREPRGISVRPRHFPIFASFAYCGRLPPKLTHFSGVASCLIAVRSK